MTVAIKKQPPKPCVKICTTKVLSEEMKYNWPDPSIHHISS